MAEDTIVDSEKSNQQNNHSDGSNDSNGCSKSADKTNKVDITDSKTTPNGDVNPTKLKMVNDNDQDETKPTCNGTMNGETITQNGLPTSAPNGLPPSTTDLIPNGHNIMNDIDEDEVTPLEGVSKEGAKQEVKDNTSKDDETTEAKDETTEVKDETTEVKDEVENIEELVKDNNKVEDVIVIQDTVFTIKIQPPGTEIFDLQVSPQEMVQEIHQVMMDREDTCHRTCFSLQLDGNVLDNFAELKSIEGLKEGTVIKVVEEPYTVREARIHVRHVRDLLKSLDPSDAYNGVDCQSLSFLNTILNDDRKRNKKTDAGSNSIDCTPPDYIMPGSKNHPLMPLQPLSKENLVTPCLKVLTVSGWNPPPGTRKMHGDLMYLFIVTLEGTTYNVTASTRGFYVNQSTQESFNPKPAEQKHLSHSLIELMNKVSPVFKKNFAQLLKKRSQRHPFERVPTPFQSYSWMAPSMEHTIDSIRAEDAYTSRLGYEEHIPGQTRDWNEEIQTTRELPRKNLPERLLRERAVFKVHSDFVAAATRGAMAVIDGNVMAINPGDDSKMQMFIWNNIFFSLGFDVRDHYKEFGGDHAAYVAPSNDLQGVKAYNGVDVDGLYTLGTVVIDYRGYRITAQSIIPGILEREQEESVIYGSIDFGKTVVTCDKYKELLTKSAQQLKILPHKVINHKTEEVEIYSSIECKGIKGNDGRHYVLDLLRTFPPDVNFLPIKGEPLAEDVEKFGFPRQHRHKLCCLRQELIEAFVEHRYMVFIKHAAYLLMQNQHSCEGDALNKDKDIPNKDKDVPNKVDETPKEETVAPNTETQESSNEEPKIEENRKEEEEEEKKEEKKEDKSSTDKDVNSNLSLDIAVANGSTGCPVLNGVDEEEMKKLADKMGEIPTEAAKALATPGKAAHDSHKDIVTRSAQVSGSLSDLEFDVRFNPDIYSEGVTHADAEGARFQKEKKLIKDAARFVIVTQIPTLIRECLDQNTCPLDGYTLTEALHQRGINMRYLGVLAGVVHTAPPLSYLFKLCVSEMIIRSVKHLFKTYIQGVSMVSLAAAMSHYLNCFLSSFPNPQAPKADDEMNNGHSKKKKGKKRVRYVSALGQDNTSWAHLTPQDMWANIKNEIKDYFHFDIKGNDSVDSVSHKYKLQRVTLLRELCTKIGIQLLLQEYDFDSKQKATFTENDIVNVFPSVKHINPIASDAYHFFQSGQAKIQQGLLREGFELINEALNLFNNVYGPMHPEIAACMRTLARLHYIMGEQNEALDLQQKAVMMSERCNGVDHPNTITEYMHLALYCFATSQLTSALKLMYRARYLVMLVFGEDHPEMSQCDSNIGLVLHGVGEYDLSLKFLQKALDNNMKFHGTKSLKAALSYHLVARVHSCRGDFRAALRNEKETYAIYKEQFGESHEKTKESSEVLSYLTQQAVTLQKTMNEMRKGGPRAAMRPLPITPPSMNSVLDTLNMINGIFLIPVSIRGVQKKTDAKAIEPSTEALPSAEDNATVETPSETAPKQASKIEPASRSNDFLRKCQESRKLRPVRTNVPSQMESLD